MRGGTLRLAWIAVGAVVACSACSPYRSYWSVGPDGSRSRRYSQINSYAAFGPGGLGEHDRVKTAYAAAQREPPPDVEIEVYNASTPEGVVVDDSVVRVEPGAPYELVGRFEIGYRLDYAPREAEIEQDLRRLAAITGGTVFIVEIAHMRTTTPRVAYFTGVVLRAVRADAVL